MRALLVCAAAVPGTIELLVRLAAQADMVVAVDGGGSSCLQAGVTPGLVLGDFDSLPEADLEALRLQGAPVVRFPAEKDASDLELAVAEVRGRGATTITLTAASSGRLDHTLAVLGVMCSARDLSPTLVEPEFTTWVLASDGCSSLEFTGAGGTISLLPFGGPAVVSASGVAWELDHARLDPGESLGLSNRIGPAGSARVSVASGVLLVFAPQVKGAVSAQVS